MVLAATRSRRSLAAALVLFVLVLFASAACGGKSDATTKAADFSYVAYNSGGVLPDGQSAFSSVLSLNKPIVLNFWGGDCPPCRAEMPDFQAIANQYRDKVVFLGIDVGPFTQLGTHDQARQLLEDLNITYPTAYAVDDAPVRAYNLQGVPTTVLITKEHTIMETNAGIMAKADLESAVKTLASK